MESEVNQLKSLVEDLFMKVESLENRVSILEDESVAKPSGPEPILTCVQCFAEYKESENAQGHCKYHSGTLKYGSWKVTYSCCNATASDRESAKLIPGCVKGKHRSKHHTDYVYANYFFYMSDLSNKAKEMWLQMDIFDLVTDKCEWGEVAVSSEGNVVILVGQSRIQPLVYAEFTVAELKKCKKSLTVFEKSDPVGWNLKAELHSNGSIANAITISLKPASYKTPLEKRLPLVYTDGSFRPGKEIECVTDPVPSKFTTHTQCKTILEGPVLDAGEDYSVGRKNDYPTETNDDMFAIELKQIGKTEVDSSRRMQNGKWNNLFTTTVKIINGSPNIISFTDAFGEYLNKDGKWTKCEDMWVGPKETDKFFETKDFLVDSAAPMSLVVRVAIGIDGPEPNGWAERCRADYSLPQPLMLRVTFVDLEKRTASLRFEQGNPPLDLPTYETRMKNWGKNKPLLFYLSADDVHARKRSDAAIYYDDNGMLVFRPAPNEQGSTSFYLKDFNLLKAAFQAKSSEVELTDMKKDNKDSSVQIFATVDVDSQITYGVKVFIKTATSTATGYFVFPKNDFSSAKLTAAPEEVLVNTNFSANWSVPRASKNDRIGIYNQYENERVSGASNRQGVVDGSLQMKAPGVPGMYEVRYYPSWLSGTYTGLRHDLFVAKASFSATSA